MDRIWLLLIVLICVSPVLGATFKNATAQVIVPTDTIMAVCAPSEKYGMEPGSTLTVKLYIRNDMSNKTIKRVYLGTDVDPRFEVVQWPDYLENIRTLPGTQVQYFLINFTAPEDMPYDNYDVRFLVGTDEFNVGSYHDDVMIKIRPYSNEIHIVFIVVILSILLLIIIRFVWIIRTNRKGLKARIRHKSKSVSQSYYKTSKHKT